MSDAAHDSPSERDVEPSDIVVGVRRLREDLEAQERATAIIGDLLRATVNALKGEPPQLTTWSTHDLPDVARAMRADNDALRAKVERLELELHGARAAAHLAVEFERESCAQLASREASRWAIGERVPTGGRIDAMTASEAIFGAIRERNGRAPCSRVEELERLADCVRAEHAARAAWLATTPPDDPEADGTDAAHPAWWRGNDAGCKGAMSLIARLRADNDALRARVAELERLAAGPATTETLAMTPEMIATWGRVLG